MSEDATLTLRLPAALRDQLNAVAEERYTNTSWLLRQLAAWFVEFYGRDAERAMVELADTTTDQANDALVAVRLPPSLKESLEAVAGREGDAVSDLCRRLAVWFLGYYARSPDRAMGEIAAPSPRGRPGRRDLGEETPS